VHFREYHVGATARAQDYEKQEAETQRFARSAPLGARRGCCGASRPLPQLMNGVEQIALGDIHRSSYYTSQFLMMDSGQTHSGLTRSRMGEVRVLSSAADAERFLDFVGECFAFRSVPRSLFANRLHHDPWRSDARIFVIEDATGRIVSGLLYYRREILVEVQSRLLVGAIADVCTRNDSRRQGCMSLPHTRPSLPRNISSRVGSHKRLSGRLCKKLLLAALEDMRAQGYAGSTLHTSQMPPVYRSVGFVSVPLKFSGQIIHAHASHDCAAAVLSSPEQIEVLMKIHDAFNEHAGFNGCTRRHHPDYWTGFMKTNMQDSGWVFHRTSDTGGSREIVAFASIRCTAALGRLQCESLDAAAHAGCRSGP
jgi:hypothetical protein